MASLLAELQNIVIPAAQEELMTRFRQVSHVYKADGSLLTEADLSMQQRVQDELNQRWPDYGFLGEEMSVEQQRAQLENNQTGLWCLDPLDGTSNFAAGIPFFSVSLALLKDGEVKLGLVYDPVRDECFTAFRGEGVWLNNEPIPRPETFPATAGIAIIDFKRLPPELVIRLAQDPPYKSQRSFGSVAIDWCWLAAGRAHLYLHGRQNLWDYAAGNLIFQMAGGYDCTLQGEPVFNNSLDARSALASPDKELYRQWRDWLSV